jgi:hypothetical protein
LSANAFTLDVTVNLANDSVSSKAYQKIPIPYKYYSANSIPSDYSVEHWELRGLNHKFGREKSFRRLLFRFLSRRVFIFGSASLKITSTITKKR